MTQAGPVHLEEPQSLRISENFVCWSWSGHLGLTWIKKTWSHLRVNLICVDLWEEILMNINGPTPCQSCQFTSHKLQA